MPLADPRLSVVVGDVADAIEASSERYDAILLDVDNGPTALSTFKNRRLYSPDGLANARRALRGKGVLAVWSTFEDARFTVRLREAGFEARTKRVLAGDGTSRRHILWLAPAGRRSIGFGPRCLEPEEISNAHRHLIVDQARPDQLGAGPGKESHPTDHQAPHLTEAVDAGDGAAREIDRGVQVELDPVVLFSEQNAAEIGGQLIDVGPGAVAADGELILGDALGEPPAVRLEGRPGTERQLLLALPERRLRRRLGHRAGDHRPPRARIGSDDADEAGKSRRNLAGGVFHGRGNLIK